MDEQRLQAYVALIEKLFACPGGEEESVLQRHSDLGGGHLRYAEDRLFWSQPCKGQYNKPLGSGLVAKLS